MEQLEQEKLESLLDLFEHEGWKLFIEEREEILEYLKEYADTNCPTNDTWQFNRGMIQALRVITSYEATIKLVMEQEEEFEQE